ncbi:hypothetical protein LTR66_011702 [Elasticomyces elasticus]|nr:hypothetical protein LTR28_005738 [Elasticomyces elasticus]KAK4969294.1 hypothetical protein LTR66_011702 [Elasticomyces elasticus]
MAHPRSVKPYDLGGIPQNRRRSHQIDSQHKSSGNTSHIKTDGASNGGHGDAESGQSSAEMDDAAVDEEDGNSNEGTRLKRRKTRKKMRVKSMRVDHGARVRSYDSPHKTPMDEVGSSVFSTPSIVSARSYPTSNVSGSVTPTNHVSGVSQGVEADLSPSSTNPEYALINEGNEVDGLLEDNDYNGVDQISDGGSSEDDSPDNEHIWADIAFKQAIDARRLSLASTDSDILSPFVDGVEPFEDDGLFTDMRNARVDHDGDTFAIAFEGQAVVRHRLENNKKSVRFVDECSSPNSNGSHVTEAANNLYPDLCDVADLRPDVLERYQNDPDDNMDMDRASSDDGGSCFDFDADDFHMWNAAENESDSDSSAGSSGYESDTGDTTDEEPVPEPKSVAKSREMAPPPSPVKVPVTPMVSPSHPASRPLSASSSQAKRTLKGPKMGFFIVDPTRFMMTHCRLSGQTIVYPPKFPSESDKVWFGRARSAGSSRLTSRQNSIQSSQTLPIDEDNHMRAELFGTVDQPGLDSLFDPLTNRFKSEAFNWSATSLQSSLNLGSTGAILTDQDLHSSTLAEQENLYTDFLDFPESDSDCEITEEDALISPSTADFPCYSSVTQESDDPKNLLAHFDRRKGVVGSFRRNQSQAKHMSALPSSPALRASTSERNAMQHGKKAAANIPMGPGRKKVSRSPKSRSVVHSPLASRVAKPRTHVRGSTSSHR